MTLCFSAHGRRDRTRSEAGDMAGLSPPAFEWFGGSPPSLIIDNTKCAITKASSTTRKSRDSYAELAEGYGFLISPCPPADPQKKGRVESGVKYVKNNSSPFESTDPWLMGTISSGGGSWRPPQSHPRHTREDRSVSLQRLRNLCCAVCLICRCRSPPGPSEAPRGLPRAV